MSLGWVEAAQGRIASRHARGLPQGGDTAPAVVPGNLEEELILQALEYTDENLKMRRREAAGRCN
jgi:hypothetical protein